MTTKNAASFNSGGEGMARTTPFASLLLRLSLETFAPPKLAVQVAKARRYWQSQSNVPAYRYQAVSTVSSTLSRPVGREQALTACFGDGGGARYSFISSSTPHPGSTMAGSLVSAGSAG